MAAKLAKCATAGCGHPGLWVEDGEAAGDCPACGAPRGAKKAPPTPPPDDDADAR